MEILATCIGPPMGLESWCRCVCRDQRILLSDTTCEPRRLGHISSLYLCSTILIESLMIRRPRAPVSRNRFNLALVRLYHCNASFCASRGSSASKEVLSGKYRTSPGFHLQMHLRQAQCISAQALRFVFHKVPTVNSTRALAHVC